MTKREQKSYFQRDMSVPKEQITIPKFKTEAEEAAWWDSHPETAAEIMEQALKSGTARRKVALKTVIMRLPWQTWRLLKISRIERDFRTKRISRWSCTGLYKKSAGRPDLQVEAARAGAIHSPTPPSYNGSMSDTLTIAGRSFHSRLIVGTGKYRSFQEMARCHEATGAEMVTVAVRRVNLTDRSKESLLDYIDRSKIFILPNTAGCYTADDAIRTARLAREVGLSNWIKLEVIGDEKTLFPDNEGLLEATRVLVKEGFVVLPYTNDDVVNARKLIDAGAAAVMPLAAPIGSGMGVQNSANLRILREMITSVPMIVDAGVGTASDAAIAMELGADGVLMNTAIAAAEDAVKMAKAMKLAVEAGRLAYLAGRMPKKLYASASSPLVGVVGQAS